MKTLKILIGTAIVLSLLPAVAQAQTLSGSDNGRPPAFSVDGPWLLDWSTESEFPLLASIEIRLYDADNGDFLGMIAELKGTGNGLKLFERPGNYQLVIVGTSVAWTINIEEVDESRAASMKRAAEGEATLLDSVRENSRLVPENSFESWRPEGDAQLLLFANGAMSWKIDFSPPCPGLADAKALSFVMRTDSSAAGQYDSILLEDGRRCFFTSVIPGYAK